MELIGVEYIEYTNKNGQFVKGTKLYCRFASEKIHGYGVKEYYISSKVDLPKLELGNKIDVYFDEYKNVKCVFVNK